MGAPTIKVFQSNERVTAEDLNLVFSTLAAKFGNIQGTDFFYPLVLPGNINMKSNRILRAKEIFEILNVEEFGSDDAGFDNALNSLANGGILYIPGNTTINISDSLKVASNRANIMVLGAGFGSEIALSTKSDSDIFAIDGADRFQMHNLRITGNKNLNTTGDGIHIKNCEDVSISNCWIGNSSTDGMAGHGINAEGCTNLEIKNCWIRYPSEHGIRLSKTTDYLIDNVTINNVGEDGIRLEDRSDRGLVKACHLLTVDNEGIAILESSFVKVQGNTVNVFGNDTDFDNLGGVSASGKSQARKAEGILIIGNVCSNGGVGGAGVLIGSWVDGSVIGNHLIHSVVTPLLYQGKEQSQVSFRANICMSIPPHGKVSFDAGKSTVALNTGYNNLPIQSIQATWNIKTDFAGIKNSVLGARYNESNGKVIFYTAQSIGAESIWYSIEI